ncbi:alpha/beta fold hydrolase [Brachybacterium sp. FME24]|uniref:alpha/beta fold hydrolase n=1 Tax=Brachybacterium sp. FME24 TaxID=2742605 RepID=UPI001868701F|nr:alpha/beta hydrolase [Brachybacterium sp. FME24]
MDATSAGTYFENHYAAMLDQWPDHEKREVEGRFGRTVALVAGPVGAPDLVLLHGRYTPSPSWAPLIQELATRYRVHAIDTMGEPGLSYNGGAPLCKRAHYPEWLGETLEGLGLGSVHLAGYSFGGWLAARFAIEQPQRLRSLTLLDPAQVFAPFSLRWMLQCVPPYLFPSESTVRRLFDWAGQGRGGHRGLVDLATSGMLSFRIRTPEAALISSKRLAELSVPTQQLIAEHTVVHDPQRALVGAARINSAVDSHLIRDSTHFLPYDQPAQVAGRLCALIDRTEAALAATRG